MPKVHVLPPDVISKIAAGEVIDRPASVVKELIENSLDAGATTVRLHLSDAGKTLISLKDDGHGIEKEDLEKVFLRHATSKISSSEDLFSIASLGFRGEALYSIGAIADVTIRSRTQDDDSGWEIHMRGGEQLSLKPVTMANPGTEIEIQELFYNTPARKKFLKRNATEMHYILNNFIPYTLLHHEVRFQLSHEGKDILYLTPNDNPIARIAHALNLEEEYLISNALNLEEKNIRMRMYLGDINIKRSRRDAQYIFVNNRPVESKSLSFHMNQIYRLIMPPDEFPFFCLMLDLPTEDLDVNIHPTKREVKIKNEQALASVLRRCVEDTLMSKTQAKKASADYVNISEHDKAIQRALNYSQRNTSNIESDSSSSFFETSEGITSKGASQKDYAYPQSRRIPQESFIPENHLFEEHDQSFQKRFERAHYIGSFMQKYLLFEFETSLFLVDQHAAAERITYERLIQQWQKGTCEVQNLLAPELIKLSPQEMNYWQEAQVKLKEIGFENNQWDEETIAIHSYPQLIKDIEKAIRQLLTGENISTLDHDAIARRACRSSIMAGDRLKNEQIEHQRKELITCLDPFTCPHGRPTIIEMTEDFLDKQFLRK